MAAAPPPALVTREGAMCCRCRPIGVIFSIFLLLALILAIFSTA